MINLFYKENRFSKLMVFGFVFWVLSIAIPFIIIYTQTGSWLGASVGCITCGVFGYLAYMLSRLDV